MSDEEVMETKALGSTSSSVPEQLPSPEELTSDILQLIATREISASGAPQLEDTLQGVMEIIAAAAGCDACALFVYDPSTETLRLRAASGSTPPVVGRIVIGLGSGITGLAASTRQTQSAARVREHPAFLPYALAGDVEYQGHASIPLVLNDPQRLIGVVNLQTHSPHEFSSAQIELVEQIAEGLAIGIAGALRYSETQDALTRRIDQIATLQAATRALATTLAAEELFEIIARHGARLAGAGNVTIYRFDADEDGLPHVTPLFPPQSRPTEAERDYALMICRTRIARSAQPTGVDGAFVFGVPLMSQLGVWGALCATTPELMAAPDEYLSVLLAFADIATLALENAQLYDQTLRESTANAALLREMHHRVRNNLQIVAALLSIQANHQPNAASAEPLRDAVGRVQAIASMHDLLSGGAIATTSLKAVLERVVPETLNAVRSPQLRIETHIECDEIIVDSRQATILALLVNECLTNAVVHGFDGRASGNIAIEARHRNGEVIVIVADDGCGPHDQSKPASNHGIGTQIVKTLASADLGGSFHIEPNLPSGTRAILRFSI